jgi:hypothetical protein
MKWFRWFAVIPSAILAWYAVFISGLSLVFALGSVCPSEDVVSGHHCGAWWYSYAEQAVIIFSVALSAFLVVVCATLVSPSHRIRTAWVSYFAGFLVAMYFVSQTSAIGEFFAATLAGLLGVFCVAKYLGRPMLPNSTPHPDAREASHLLSSSQSRASGR